MLRHWTQVAAYTFIFLCLILGQNCADKNFEFVKKSEDLLVVDDRTPIRSEELPPPAVDTPYVPQDDVVCDPLRSKGDCSDLGKGLRGVVYSLAQANFPGNRDNATLDDYISLGDKSTFDIIMSAIDVPKSPWDRGFILDNGDYIRNGDGEMLNEYFAIDLYGYVGFPKTEGAKLIEFAIVSDDGMRVFVGGQEVVNDDKVHGARWACGSVPVAFAEGQRKTINVQWFQGPRYNIAMQLFYRPVSQDSRPCNENGGWIPFTDIHFSH